MTKSVTKWIKEIISTKEAPPAVGPYSQAVGAGPLLFVSGQLGLVPGSKDFLGSTADLQTRQAMENLAAVLEAGGSSLDLIVKTTIYLKDIGDFPAVNEVYGSFFEGDPPARETVQVAGMPLNGLVQISVVALRD
ncbi:MAG: Rid family detoxifying hydrolase [Thermoplasmatota archaeon]